MTPWEVSDLLGRLDGKARKQPQAFRWSLFAFVLLGYLGLAVCFGVLVFCIAVGIYLFMVSWSDEGPRRVGFESIGPFLIAAPGWILIRFIVLWARYRPGDASVRIDLSEKDALAGTLRELEDELGAPRIREVRIDGTINARAAYEGVLGVIGLGRPVLYLGAPLVSFLSFAQLRAVIAHELAHFSAGHGKFGWLYQIIYPWTILDETLASSAPYQAAALVRGAFFWVIPFIKWYFPRLQARYQTVLRWLYEVTADQDAVRVSDPEVYGSMLIQTAILAWLNIGFDRELEREARRTGIPTHDLTQRRLAYLQERLNTFPLQAAVWFVLGEQVTMGQTHPVLSERLIKCGLPVDRDNPLVLNKLTRSLTFSSVGPVPNPVAASLKELDERVYEMLAEAWAIASVNARNYSVRLEYLDKKLRSNQLSDDEAWERVQLVGLFGPKARHHEEIRKFHEQYPDNIGGKILSALLDLHGDEAPAPAKIEAEIQQAPVYALMALEALEFYYAKQLRFEEAQQQAERRQKLVKELKILEREKNLIRPEDKFISAAANEEQRSKLAAKLARTGLVKRAYLLAKAVDTKNTRSFDILGLKLFRHAGREPQHQQLRSTLEGTQLTVLLLEKRHAGLEKVFRRVRHAELDLDAAIVLGKPVPKAATNTGRDGEQIKALAIKGNTKPPTLPSAFLPPPPPLGENDKKTNPGLLVLLGITAVSIFASIVIVVVFVSRLNTWHRNDPVPSEARAEEEMNSQEAISQLTDAIQSDPTNPDLFLKRGIAFANAVRYSEAISDYSRVVQLQPDNAKAYFLRGNLEEYQGRSAQALVDYGQAIRYDQNPASAYQRRGKLYFRLEKYDEAVSDLSKVIELVPNMQTSYWDRAMAYAGKLNHEKAIEDYTTAVSFGNAPNILVERGEEYLKIGDYQKALTDFNEVMRIKGDSAQARFGRAQCYYQLHDYDHTIADCAVVIRSAPRYVDAYRLRAQAYQQKQQLTEAQADLEIAKRLQSK